MNYDLISQIFVALVLLGYLVFLAALGWWGFAPRFRPALRTLDLVSAQARRTVRFWMTQLKRGELKLRTNPGNDYKAPWSGRN